MGKARDSSCNRMGKARASMRTRDSSCCRSSCRVPSIPGSCSEKVKGESECWRIFDRLFDLGLESFVMWVRDSEKNKLLGVLRLCRPSRRVGSQNIIEVGKVVAGGHFDWEASKNKNTVCGMQNSNVLRRCIFGPVVYLGKVHYLVGS